MKLTVDLNTFGASRQLLYNVIIEHIFKKQRKFELIRISFLICLIPYVFGV